MIISDGTSKFRVRDQNTDRVPTGIVEFFAGQPLLKVGLFVTARQYHERNMKNSLV